MHVDVHLTSLCQYCCYVDNFCHLEYQCYRHVFVTYIIVGHCESYCGDGGYISISTFMFS